MRNILLAFLFALVSCVTPVPAQSDRIIIELADTPGRSSVATARAVEVELAGTDYKVHRRYKSLPYLALEAGPECLKRLEASGNVVAVHPDGEFTTQLTTAIELIGADKAHAAGRTGKGQSVAILDTGVDLSHSAFAGRIVAEACFTHNAQCPNGQDTMIGPGAGAPCKGNCTHGTHVAGIAAGGLSPIIGAAPDAGIVAVQVFTISTSGSASAFFSDIIAAHEWVASVAAEHKIASINMSLGTGAQTANPCDASFPTVKAAVDVALAAGVGVVAASGNGSSKTGISAPGCLSNVMSVGCTDDNDGICSFSNRGPGLEIWAPGLGIESAAQGGGVSRKSGTSMSAPFVAGSYAVLQQAAAPTHLPPNVIRGLLKFRGKQIAVPPGEPTTVPRLDLLAAINIDPNSPPDPICGDNFKDPGEECDGTDDAACPGMCAADCACDIGECADSDGDGEADETDGCPDSAPGSAVDHEGCDRDQFCERVEVKAFRDRKLCRSSDWRNDEPTTKRPVDCMVAKQAGGRVCIRTDIAN